MRKIFTYIAAALLAVSCVYEYDIDVKDVEERLVFEGSIVLGGTSTIEVSQMQRLDASLSDVEKTRPVGTAYLETPSGKIINPTKKGKASSFTFDTRDLPEDDQYRLHFTTAPGGKVYVSSFLGVSKAPQVDKLYYSSGTGNVDIKLDLSAPGDESPYCKWDYKEVWEYTADYPMLYQYIPDRGRVVEVSTDHQYDYWYCWDESSSDEYGLASMEGLSPFKTEGQAVLSIPRSSKKMSSLYEMKLTLIGMSHEGYWYFKNMKDMSNMSGDLFSANPSEVTGNMSCLDDPDEFVAGFIDVVTETEQVLWISGCYAAPDFSLKLKYPNATPYNELYAGEQRPVLYGTDVFGDYGLLWGPTECVDCRGYGGTKTKPEGWPTLHK